MIHTCKEKNIFKRDRESWDSVQDTAVFEILNKSYPQKPFGVGAEMWEIKLLNIDSKSCQFWHFNRRRGTTACAGAEILAFMGKVRGQIDMDVKWKVEVKQ